MEPITVPGTLDSLKTIANYVMSAAEQAGLDKKEAYKLRLAVDEVATNTILHGYEEAGLTGNIDLSTNITDQAITITLEDSAIPYNPLQHNCPDESDLQQSLVERDIGGLGVFLAIDGVDDFTYEFINNRNRNHFTLNRSVAKLNH